MKTWNSGKEQDKIIRGLERQERQQAYQQDRFLKFKLNEIHRNLVQTLLMEKIVETENPAAISDAILNGLKKAMNSEEFDLQYFVAPIRGLVPRPNPYSLYMTQFIMEVLIDNPEVVEIYGTDLEIYKVVNKVFSQISIRFERTEEEIKSQLARNQSLIPGSREYEIALDELMRNKLGEPEK